MRDAQTMVEQILAFGERKVTGEVVALLLGASDRVLHRRLIEALVARDAAAAVAVVRELYRGGKELERASQGVLTLIHHLALAASLGTTAVIDDVSEEERQWIASTAAQQESAEWLRLFDFWNRQHDLIVRSDYALMLFEVSVLMAASLPAMEDLRAFFAQLKQEPSGTLAAPRRHTEAATPSRESAPRRSSPVETTPVAEPAPVRPAASTAPLVSGWREFLESYQKEDPFLVTPLKVAPYQEEADGVTITLSKVLDRTIGDRRETLIEAFAARTGGKKLSFVVADRPGAGRSVAAEEKREADAQDAKDIEEIRNDPVVKQIEQLGFELKKIRKDS